MRPFRCFARTGCILALAVVLNATDRALGSPSSDDNPTSFGADIRPDPAFARYVDLDQLALAWSDKNPSLLTDFALQLAEGERVLQRSHKGITSDRLLSMAARIAAEKKDKAALARLGKAADSLKKPELAAQIATAQGLASASRDADPAQRFQIDRAKPEDFLLFRDSLDSILNAKLAGDADTLDVIIQLTPGMTQLSDQQRKYLVKAATQARDSLPKDSSSMDPTADAIESLLSGSRSPGNPSSAREANLKISYRGTRQGCRVVSVDKDGSLPLADGSKLQKGDLILRVGAKPAYGTIDLTALINEAYQSGNTEVLVFEAKTRRVKKHSLPPTAAVQANATKPQPVEPKQ